MSGLRKEVDEGVVVVVAVVVVSLGIKGSLSDAGCFSFWPASLIM